MQPNWKDRYQAVHEQYFKGNTPQTYRDGFYTSPKYPKVDTSNGLQMAIKMFCTWSGHYCNRINTQGQVRVEKIKLAFGNERRNVKWTKGQTTKGTADLDINLKHPSYKFGIPVKAEVKTNKDTQRDEQKAFEKSVSATGAIYVIIKTIDQWFKFYDETMRS